MATISNLTDAPAKQEVKITRVFDAPRALVFKMWTDPALVERWWGPKDFTNPVCRMDTKEGGGIRIVMQGPDGTQYPTRGWFTQLIEPELIVFKSIKEDDYGNSQLELINTVRLSEEGGKTTMFFHAEVTLSTPEACGSIDGMNTGWNQSIDRLATTIEMFV
jgi:uncharacterized protein YndB with AHSA1/START domain